MKPPQHPDGEPDATPDSDHDSDHDPDRVATAWHEAGHAVMAIAVGRQIQKVTIVPAQMTANTKRLGAMKMQKGRSKSSSDLLEDEVLILFAGMVAESFVTGEYCQHGAASDLRAVAKLLDSRANTQKQFEKLHRRLLEKTEYLLSDDLHKPAIKLVAEALLEKETVSGRLVRHFLNQTAQQHKK